MSALTDRITEVLREHLPVRPGERVDCCGASITGNRWSAHVAERIAAELGPALGELEATKALLAATQELHSRTIADFCALRDALPRKQVEQILSEVES